jgi:hypothetical protein
MFGTDNVKEVSPIIPRLRVEGCVLSTLKRGDYQGKMTLEFTFKQTSTGSMFTHKEFDPSEKSPNDTQEKYEQKISWVMSRIKHIMGRFMSEEEATIPSQPTWEAFLAEVGKRMNGKYQGKECALKLVYNSKDFTSFPMFPPFISTEAYPKEFEANPQYDRFEKQGSEGTTDSPEMNGQSNASSSSFFDDDDEPAPEAQAPTQEAQAPTENSAADDF